MGAGSPLLHWGRGVCEVGLGFCFLWGWGGTWWCMCEDQAKPLNGQSQAPRTVSEKKDSSGLVGLMDQHHQRHLGAWETAAPQAPPTSDLPNEKLWGWVQQSVLTGP